MSRQKVSTRAEGLNSVRVMGLGNGLRWYALFIAVLLGAVVWPKAGGSLFDLELPLLIYPLLCASFLVLMALRSIFVGVWLHDDKLVARTLFRTLKVARPDIQSCDTTSATIWPSTQFDSVWLRELAVTTTQNRRHRLWGSVALAKRSKLQERQIRAYIQGASIEQTLSRARADSGS